MVNHPKIIAVEEKLARSLGTRLKAPRMKSFKKFPYRIRWEHGILVRKILEMIEDHFKNFPD